MVIRKMSADERAKEVSRRREKRLHDEADALSFAREEGIAKGKAEERENLSLNLREMGFTEEQIKQALRQRS